MPWLLHLLLSNAAVATAMAAGLLVVSPFVRHPQARHFLWLLVLVRLVMPPVLTVDVAPPVVEAEPVAIKDAVVGELKPTEAAPAANASPGSDVALFDASGRAGKAGRWEAPIIEHVLPPWWSGLGWGDVHTALMIVWVAGAAIYSLIVLGRSRAFAVSLRELSRDAAPDLQAEIADVARRMGLRRLPRIAMIEQDAGPMVWRYGLRATLILPSLLIEQMTPRERQLLIAHELVHLRRGDDWLMWFAAGVKAAYWWVPTSWLAARRMQRAAEECCDAAVLAMFDESDAYAETVYRAAEFASTGKLPSPLLSGSAGDKHHLKARLDMILSGPIRKLPKLTWLSLFVVSVFFNGLFLRWAGNEVKFSAVRAGIPPDSAIFNATVVDSFKSGMSENESNLLLAASEAPPPATVYLLSEAPATTAPTLASPQPPGRFEVEVFSAFDSSRYVKTEEKSNLSEEVRKKVIAKLGEKVNDSDQGIVKHSLLVIAGSGDKAAIEAALVAILTQSKNSNLTDIDRLQFAWEMYRRGIADEKVREQLKAASGSKHESIRWLATCLLIAADGNAKSLEHVKLLIRMCEEVGADKPNGAPDLGLDTLLTMIPPVQRMGTLRRLLDAHSAGLRAPELTAVVAGIREDARSNNLKIDSVRGLARFALSRVKVTDDDVALLLLEAADHQDPQVRAAATTALGRALAPFDRKGMVDEMKKSGLRGAPSDPDFHK